MNGKIENFETLLSQRAQTNILELLVTAVSRVAGVALFMGCLGAIAFALT